MDDPQENGAIVNALQRAAAVVVQKSIAEGFGLTVAERQESVESVKLADGKAIRSHDATAFRVGRN